MQTIKQLICLSCFIALELAIGAVDGHARGRIRHPAQLMLCSVMMTMGCLRLHP